LTLDEAKAYLGDKYVLSPNYKPAENPQHNVYEHVNIALTISHVRHGKLKAESMNARFLKVV
jgi:hypothetical protein